MVGDGRVVQGSYAEVPGGVPAGCLSHQPKGEVEQMDVLVTGGAGFIGSNLVTALAARGARVRVLDDLSTGSMSNLREVAEDVEVIVGTSGPPIRSARLWPGSKWCSISLLYPGWLHPWRTRSGRTSST
jgi:NAD dependent epimerase/dehydratase family